jgi:hypothetical protein
VNSMVSVQVPIRADRWRAPERLCLRAELVVLIRGLSAPDSPSRVV